MDIQPALLHADRGFVDRFYIWSSAILCLLILILVRIGLRWTKTRIARRSLAAQKGCKAPPNLSNSNLPTLGIPKLRESAESIQKGSYLELTQARFENTNTYTSNNLGVIMIDTCEPQNIRTMLALKFRDFELGEQRRYAFSPLLGQGIFASDGEIWKHSRSRLRPHFATDISSHLSVFETYFQDFLQVINLSPDRSIDLSDLFFLYTLDTATQLFFGSSSSTLEARLKSSRTTTSAQVTHNDFAAAFNRTQRKLADDIVLGRMSSLVTSSEDKRQYEQDCAVVRGFVARAIDEHKASSKLQEEHENGQDYILLSELLKDEADQDVIRDELINILVAARDTTASLLSSLWFTLARTPSVYQRLRHEIIGKISVDTTKLPTLSDLESMPYLRACIDEALRLFPPVPVNSRTATSDTVLPCGGGDDGKQPILVTAGTRVGYNVYALHRREDLWGSDAHCFRPDRWLEPDSGKHRTDWHFLPFNGGPRVCLGQKLALIEARYLTCRLVQHFSCIEAASDTKLVDREEFEAGMMSKQGSANLASDKCSSDTGPACSWKWEEALTLSCSSRNGTMVRMIP